ncbi:hypothetical protein, partial [Marivita sp.]|uniref:hypothetical protein n=1 Tax=Marivita sp. TaxID=2003365 RepID=UPI0025B7E252
TRKIDDGSVVHDGGAPLDGGLCRNNKPTRCTAVIQTAQTPDSAITPSRSAPLAEGCLIRSFVTSSPPFQDGLTPHLDIGRCEGETRRDCGWKCEENKKRIVFYG